MERARFVIIFFIGFTHLVVSQTVAVQYDKYSSTAAYAGRKLEKSLLGQGYQIKGVQVDYLIDLALDDKILDKEAYAITREGDHITITGGDGKGLIYGSLS